MKKILVLFLVLRFWSSIERASAAEYEPLGKALGAILGTTQVSRKVLGDATVFFTKSANGSLQKVAFVQHGVYQPNCNHTWVIGVDPASGKITDIHVTELSCPHALPIRGASFLDQYRGKGPADVSTLSSKVVTLAKATGSCNLTTDAVKRTITEYVQNKGSL